MFRLVIIFSFLSTIAFAQPTNVLFIGNSYTHMNNLCKIFQNIANSKGKIVFADTLAVSGSNLKGHTLRENTYKKIQAKSWDYVFIQGYSRELSYDSTRIVTETIPYAKQLVDSIKRHNPCVNIYYYMTWGYADGFKDSVPGDNYHLMQERIEKGYMLLSEETGGLPVAPVGMVWKTIHDTYPEINLYAPDRAHPSIYGSYIAACTFYSAIYKESSEGCAMPKKVDLLYARFIQSVSTDYVLEHYTKYNLDTVQVPKNSKPPKLDFQIKEKWLSITISNKSSGGAKYYWDFGDGACSTKKNPKHYYKKTGKYTVTLYVKSKCDWYKMKKVIRVSSTEMYGNTPSKPKNTSN